MFFFYFHHNRFTDVLPTSPQPLWDDHLWPRYGRKGVQRARNILKLGPRPPKMKKYIYYFFGSVHSLYSFFAFKKNVLSFFFLFFSLFGAFWEQTFPPKRVLRRKWQYSSNNSSMTMRLSCFTKICPKWSFGGHKHAMAKYGYFGQAPPQKKYNLPKDVFFSRSALPIRSHPLVSIIVMRLVSLLFCDTNCLI